MELLLYKAFYETNAAAFPMDFQALASYIWLQQAFLSLIFVWIFEEDIFHLNLILLVERRNNPVNTAVGLICSIPALLRTLPSLDYLSLQFFKAAVTQDFPMADQQNPPSQCFDILHIMRRQDHRCAMFLVHPPDKIVSDLRNGGTQDVLYIF